MNSLKPVEWNEHTITDVLAKSEGSPFYWKQNFVVIRNVSHGFLNWEADLLVCSKAGFLTEIEVKISAADWRNDKNKWKFRLNNWGNIQTTFLKKFYYAAPKKLALRWAEMGIPEYAGVIAMENDPRGSGEHAYFVQCLEIIRPAKASATAKKLTIEEQAKLARLGAIRQWV
jgi:hypothetical protein